MNRKLETKVAVVTGVGTGLEAGKHFEAEGARVFITGPATRHPQDSDEVLENTRNRPAEFYFNGTCLVRSIFCGAFRKVPFFLRHLWCALAE